LCPSCQCFACKQHGGVDPEIRNPWNDHTLIATIDLRMIGSRDAPQRPRVDDHIIRSWLDPRVFSAPSPLFVVFQSRWGFSSGMLTVAFGVYAITLLIVLLTAGSLSDHVGRRPVVIAALVIQSTHLAKTALLIWWDLQASASMRLWGYTIASMRMEILNGIERRRR
jgi:hypothetical protein